MAADSLRSTVSAADALQLPASEMVEAIAANPDLSSDEAVRARHKALQDRSSVCSYCGVGCPYSVEPDAKGVDRVVPMSPLGLCVKGKTSLMTGSDGERVKRMARRGLADDRIRAPMIRGHDGKMKEVSWDEALDRAAWLFLHAREWVGPDACAIYGNGQKTIEAIWMASLYKLVFKLPTIGANSEHCLTSAGAAHALNFGNEASFTWRQFDELLECDVAIMHGTNPFVTFPQAYEKIKRNTRAVKVVIDPTTSDTASDLLESDPRTLHIRFRQGGDVMFNLAVARHVLEQGWQDDASIAARIDPGSYETFRDLVMQDRCAPDAVARRIALPDQDAAELADTIRAYAELIARPVDGVRPKPAFVSSMGINQSTGSVGFSTNLNLLLLTGNVGRRGAGSMRIAGQSNATSELMMGFNGRKLVFNHDPANPEHRAALAKVLDLPEGNIPQHAGTPVAQMASDDHIYCFIFVGTQMTKNMPRVGHWSRRMGRAFNIVIDSFLGEGVLDHADVLLPSLTYVEKTGVIQRGDRTMQLQQQLSTPPEKAWADEQILARLALKIAERLRNPDTAALNDLDADVVHRTFARYLDNEERIMPARVFDHIVETSRELDMYCRLENQDGEPISHDMLRSNAGMGVQWGGNGRYSTEAGKDAEFPGVRRTDTKLAKLVCPPDDFMAKLEAPLPPGTLSLISGRGRPGRQAIRGRGRYNSGIKTLPIYGLDPEDHFVEIHPDEAAERGLSEGDAVQMIAGHGAVIANVALNDRIARGTAFIDFVPGEVNRLTDYKDADAHTHQSLIKRTPVTLNGLRPMEEALWTAPDAEVLMRATDLVHAEYRRVYPEDTDWVDTQRGDARHEINWLFSDQLRDPKTDADRALSEAVGALTAFFQRYSSSDGYKAAAGDILRGLDDGQRDRFLRVFLPLLRRLDYQSVMHMILADFVGPVKVVDADGVIEELDLLTAHKSAVLEFKEEIVAIQLFVAAKRGIDLLFGEGAVIARDDLAFVSGVAIPCAGDVPAHFLGISPADIGSALLVHSRAIGNSALLMVDRKTNRAVRINVVTGVLPKDKELTQLRGKVINRKRAATAHDHCRFFDRLGELIVDYVRTGDENFEISGPVDLDWDEYRKKLSFSPANKSGFVKYLVHQRISKHLADAFVGLGILDETKDMAALEAIRTCEDTDTPPPAAFNDEKLYEGTLQERVDRVVEQIIAPVLANDGGRLDVLEIDEPIGELRIRFVGSCANCPYSLLSMEQIVKPTLLAIPGIQRVVHRAKPRDREVAELKAPAA
ncbi:molybdopterin-dependent oxidoreductase [Minwuia sp.]|uniref:molybdopterin-dependent oxidoreductase n=1 Tax=Minwuia sp. TaxID=2493630 RepID=UPI003A8D0948